MSETNAKGDKRGEKGGHDGSQEITAAYDAIDRLEKNFTAENFSRAPLALLKAGLKGDLGATELTANFRGLETAFKPVDAAIRLRKMNIVIDAESVKGQSGLAERFLAPPEAK